jgi:hypothetical protein
MPVASRQQCKNPKGFSQIASCKAQGFIPRTSKKLKGKLVKSDKYKRRSSRSRRSRRSLRSLSRRSRRTRRSR